MSTQREAILKDKRAGKIEIGGVTYFGAPPLYQLATAPGSTLRSYKKVAPGIPYIRLTPKRGKATKGK